MWDREYRHLKAIPSSDRTSPAKALRLFRELFDLHEAADVLDAGCGPGRNSAYLAAEGCNVTAVDFCDIALARTAAAVTALRPKIGGRVSVVNADLNGAFPFKDNMFDLSIDSYLSCHFLDRKVIHSFWKEMARVTRPGGNIFSCVFTTRDEYYRHSLRETTGRLPYVTDPANGISKRLYTEGEFRSLIGRHFDIRYFTRFAFYDMVLEKRYLRELFVVAATPI